MEKMKKTLDWDVVTAPVHVNSNKLSNRVAIVRNDNGETLSLRSGRYRPFKNTDLKGLVGRILSKTNYELIGYQEFRKGRRVIAYLKLNQENLPKGSTGLTIGTSATNDYLLIGNAHDGSSSLFIAFTNLLLRCENQFTMPIRIFGMEHRKQISLNGQAIDNLLHSFHRERNKVYELMTGWMNLEASKQLIDRFINHLFPLGATDKIAEEIKLKRSQIKRSIDREIGDLGRNYWGLFNGVTHFSTPRSDNSLFGNPYSQGNKLNARAIRFLKQESKTAWKTQ
jgi:hypothetical protein